MKLELYVNVKGQALVDNPGPELAIILEGVADLISGGYMPDKWQTLFDPEGNRVGSWRMTE